MLKKLEKIRDQKSEKGFTIIEVMIVLAIAGLILLIVFLAVPALQRNGRNTQRKSDAGNMASAYSNTLSNNNGTVPSSCDANTSTCFLNDAKIGFYDTTAAGNAKFVKQATATAPANVADADKIAIYNYAKCGTTASTTTQGTATTTTTGASSRTAVILYAVEAGSGTTYICQDI